MGVHYLDTSALVKLVVDEPETAAFRRWLRVDGRSVITSDLARTELMRAAGRVDPDLRARARLVLDSVTITQISTTVFHEAGRLEPATLRSLDALHLAAALRMGDELDGLVTYDDRLASAATANGIPVAAPA